MPCSRNIRLLSLILLGSAFTHGTARPIPVISATKDSHGVTFTMRPGKLRIEVCTDRIIHVVYSPTDSVPERKSFVVIKEWDATPFELKDSPDTAIISTGKMQVKVDKSSGAIHFLNPTGQPILDEPADGGKSMTPATVNNERSYAPEQTFVSPAGEFLYGMGQHPQGTWNWRGIPLELRQLNTEIDLPMLISSKGYGLLWDNASLTDFNPIDQEIAVEPVTHTGSFTTGAAGDYVFMVKDGDRKGEIGVKVDGRVVAEIKNRWVTYALSGKINLPANKPVAVQILGGGKTARVFARPLGNTTTFRSQVGDAIDYTFFYGPQLDDVIAGYRTATGAAPMWPKWAFGFWQCRERYSSQQQLLDAANEFRQRRIPIDLIVQDWKYWGSHGFGAYQWDETNYPAPATMIAQLHDQNIKFIISVWSNPSGETQNALKAINGLIPGTTWMDVYDPKVRAVRWQFMNKAFFGIGTDAWWQDATEPGDDGNSVDHCQIFTGSANRVRNAYPLFASEATYEGQRATTSDKRVVNLTRSGYPGQQRYSAACWSGDIAGDWITLRRQIADGLNFCLAGIPYWTTDTGGFFRPRNQVASPDYNEVLTRWFEFSTFSPILRMHGYQTETEMWKFPLSEKNLESYDALRYRLLPYNYSVAWKVTHEGYTFMRALPMDFQTDPKALDISDEFMSGPAFLVAPVTEFQASSRSVYLPSDTVWIDFWTGQTSQGGQSITADAPIEKIPLYVRGGSIVPFGPDLQYAMEKPADPIELRVYRGADGAFTLYEDEGDNYHYEKGVFATIPLAWNERSGMLTIGERQGRFPGMLASRSFHIVWVSPNHGAGPVPTSQADKEVTYTGASLTISAP